MTIKRWITSAVAITSLWLLVACAVTDSSTRPILEKNARWVILPFANLSETVHAGLRAEAIADALLRIRGVAGLQRYPSAPGSESLFEPTERKVSEDALKWAKDQGFRYALTGNVSEWRYKVGLDGEPAVGLALQVVDVDTGAIAWSAVGARTGWSRESVTAIAQKLIKQLLADATFK